MKYLCCKYKRTAALTLLMLMLSVLVLSGSVLAADKFVTCDSADFSIMLDDMGGAQITESWSCYFGGDISRYSRHYRLEDISPDCFTLEEVYLDHERLELLSEPDDARPEGCAAVYESDGRINVDIYMRSSDEPHLLQVVYYVENAVLVHYDAAEFKWNLTSAKQPFTIGHVSAYIQIPRGTKDRGLYFWGHGPEENSSFTAQPDSGGLVNEFVLDADNVSPDTPVSIRFAMPTELFPNSNRHSEEYKLEDIIYEEEHKKTDSSGSSADENSNASPAATWQNRLLLVWKILALIMCGGPIVLYLIFSGLLRKLAGKVFVSRKYKKYRLQPTAAPQYLRTFLDHMKPALVHKLMSVYAASGEGKKVARDGSAFSATIMDLIEQGYLTIGKDEQGQVTYLVSQNPDAAALTDYENIMLDIFVQAGAQEAPKATEDVKQYMRSNYTWCEERYRSFNDDVDSAFDQLGICTLRPCRQLSRITFIVLSILLGLFIAFGTWQLEALRGIPAIILGLVFGALDVAAISATAETLRPEYTILTQEGENRYALWNAYARFLDDFTTFSERQVPDILTWKKHLVYAAALGRSKEVMESLRVSLPEFYGVLITDPYFADFDDMEESIEIIDTEGGYTIRSSSVSGGSSSDDDDGWGGMDSSDCDYGSGDDGSDFD